MGIESDSAGDGGGDVELAGNRLDLWRGNGHIAID